MKTLTLLLCLCITSPLWAGQDEDAFAFAMLWAEHESTPAASDGHKAATPNIEANEVARPAEVTPEHLAELQELVDIGLADDLKEAAKIWDYLIEERILKEPPAAVKPIVQPKISPPSRLPSRTQAVRWPRYPTNPRQGPWTQNGRHVNWRHLLEGRHAGKFDAAWLKWTAENVPYGIEQIHADDHEGKVHWAYVVRPQPVRR